MEILHAPILHGFAIFAASHIIQAYYTRHHSRLLTFVLEGAKCAEQISPPEKISFFNDVKCCNLGCCFIFLRPLGRGPWPPGPPPPLCRTCSAGANIGLTATETRLCKGGKAFWEAVNYQAYFSKKKRTFQHAFWGNSELLSTLFSEKSGLFRVLFGKQ